MSTIAKTVRPVLTETAEEDVFVTDFAAAGLPGIAAVTFLGPEIGLKVIVDEHLSATVRNDAINAVLERLVASPMPRRFALIKSNELPGCAA